MTRMTVKLAFPDLSIDVPFEELDLQDLTTLYHKLDAHRGENTVENSAKYWLTTKVMDTLEELINEKKLSVVRPQIVTKADLEIGGRHYRVGDVVSADDIDEFMREHNAEEYGEKNE